MNKNYLCWIPAEQEEKDAIVFDPVTYLIYDLYQVAIAAAKKNYCVNVKTEHNDDLVTWRIKCPDGHTYEAEVEKYMKPYFTVNSLKEIK